MNTGDRRLCDINREQVHRIRCAIGWSETLQARSDSKAQLYGIFESPFCYDLNDSSIAVDRMRIKPDLNDDTPQK